MWKEDKWRELSKQNKKEDITVYANRGNLSSDGRFNGKFFI
jgi:hypothetical protein